VIALTGRKPGFHRRMHMRAVVIENQMNLAALRGNAVNLLEKRQRLGVPLAGCALREDRAFQHVQRGEQIRRAVPHVVMRLARRNPARTASAAASYHAVRGLSGPHAERGEGRAQRQGSTFVAVQRRCIALSRYIPNIAPALARSPRFDKSLRRPPAMMTTRISRANPDRRGELTCHEC
jgi:hypothetical protein